MTAIDHQKINTLILISIITLSIYSCGEGSGHMKSVQSTVKAPIIKSNDEWVVLVHGMLSSTRAMRKIEKELLLNGYHVINFGYNSREESIQTVAQNLDMVIRDMIPGNARSVHFVTHSLGSLVVRYYLSENHLTKLGRFVMIAPPNQGSVWGKTLVKNIPVFRYLLGISGEELQYSLKYRPAQPPPCEFGIISGGTGKSRGLNPFIPGDNDATVAVSETVLSGMKDHVIIQGQHTLLLFQKRVINNVVSFLRTGRFIY